MRRPIGELPSIWIDRHVGDSNFQLRRWLPEYLHWYRFAFGRRLTEEQLRAHCDRRVMRRSGPSGAGAGT